MICSFSKQQQQQEQQRTMLIGKVKLRRKREALDF